MSKYDAQKFLDVLNSKVPHFPRCPICNGDDFATVPKYASIPVGDNLGTTTLGPSVPAGMIICQKCGYIHFFSLGVLKLTAGGGK